MDKPYATPARFGADKSPSPSSHPLRSIAIPLFGAAVLVALFLVLLLSSPGSRATADGQPTATAVAGAAADGTAAGGITADDALVSPAERCPVPPATGHAGVVASRFAGKPTSSGHRYQPQAPECIVNAAGALGQLAYGTEVRLSRRDAPQRDAVCAIVGRWNGEKFPDRIVLVSSAVAADLAIGDRGLVEVATDCAPATGSAQLAARSALSTAGS